MRIFFDTSAFVKRYVEEPGSERVADICRSADSLMLSIICIPEVISTLNRLVREGKISRELYFKMKDIFFNEINFIDICPLTSNVIRLSVQCLERHPLRAMDAIHIACALSIGPDLFVTSDKRQTEAARAEGLTVEEVWENL
jgi:hypothetical protein